MSGFKLANFPMPLSIDNVVQLLIVFKEHMQSPTDPTLEKNYIDFFNELMQSKPITGSDGFAAPLFPNQPPIPFVKFSLKHTDSGSMPVIIHTHGGPDSYIDKNNIHRIAESAYFLSQGYTVVCPNYRGSTAHPELNAEFLSQYPNFQREWKAWEKQSRGKHHIYGPEDVYAVTQTILQDPSIDKTKVFLRGLSFGSFINVHLLVGIQQGKFESLYRGVHLSSTLHFPPAALLPENVPLLITHSTQDSIAPYREAKLFMESLLIRKILLRKNKGRTTYLQVFVSQTGNHHMIAPDIEPNSRESLAYMELKRYAELYTSFCDEASKDESCIPVPPEIQLNRLIEESLYEHNKKNTEDSNLYQRLQISCKHAASHFPSLENECLEEDPYAEIYTASLKPLTTMNPVTPHFREKMTLQAIIPELLDVVRRINPGFSEQNPLLASTPEPLSEEAKRRIRIYEYSFRGEVTPPNNYFVLLPPLRPLAAIRAFYGPTMGLLKLHLKEQFSGEVATDFTNFLHSHFSPVAWDDRTKIRDAGQQILALPELREQYVEMIQREERFLQHNPSYLVLYHAANEDTLQLYSFINVWEKQLRGEVFTTLPTIDDTRLYDFVRNSFDDIDSFLKEMHQKSTLNASFNYTEGFQDRALACNPSLISNAHNTSSCSLLWYFQPEWANKDKTPVEIMVSALLRLLNLASPERIARYVQLFSRHVEKPKKNTQALMQQLFVPKKAAEKLAYNCLTWGMEFDENNLNLRSINTLNQLVEDPNQFEENLRLNATAFKNHGGCPAFGNLQAGFYYANAIQVRYLPRYNPEIFTQSYFRDPEAHHAFISELIALVREDYSDFLASTSQVPDYLILGSSHADTVRYRFFNSPPLSIPLEGYYLTQKQLYLGLVQNPSHAVYGDIHSLSRSDKITLQRRFQTEGLQSVSTRLCPFALCRYLKGYTYFELLIEAARVTLLTPETPFGQEAYQLLIQLIDASMHTTKICIDVYERLQRLLRDKLTQHVLNDSNHAFFHPVGSYYTERELWNLELAHVKDYVLHLSELLKEQSTWKKPDVKSLQVALCR